MTARTTLVIGVAILLVGRLETAASFTNMTPVR